MTVVRRSVVPAAAAATLALTLGLGLGLGACSEKIVEVQQVPVVQPGDGDDGGDPGAVDAAVVVDAGPDVDMGHASNTYPAPHPAAPQIESYGGTVLTTPKVVPIVFSTDPLQTQIADFSKKVGQSSYWKAITSEYGIGALTGSDPVVLTTAPPTDTTDDDIKAFLGTLFDGTHAQLGTTPDPSTIYAIFYPAGTTITIPEWGQSCQGFGGYHFDGNIKGTTVPYAVIPRCDGFFGMSGIDVVTTAASHEYLEAVTDPFASTKPAYSVPDESNYVWAKFPLSELGDMCSFNADAYYTPTDVGYQVQRTWSNAAAAAGHHPCVPAPAPSTQPYFNTVPVLAEDVDVGFGHGQAAPSKGVKIPVGKSKTIELDLFSDAPTSGPWTITATDTSAYYQKGRELSFSFDKNSGVNGEKVHMTITADKPGEDGGSEFIIISKLGKQQTLWVGWVQN